MSNCVEKAAFHSPLKSILLSPNVINLGQKQAFIGEVPVQMDDIDWLEKGKVPHVNVSNIVIRRNTPCWGYDDATYIALIFHARIMVSLMR